MMAAWRECRKGDEMPWVALGYESKKLLKLLGTGVKGGYASLGHTQRMTLSRTARSG